MICYRDITFCEAYKECADGEGCPKALTQDVIDAANKWLPPYGPISVCRKLDCFKKRKKTNEH